MRQLTNNEVIYRTSEQPSLYLVPKTGSINLQFQLPDGSWVNDGNSYTQSEAIALKQADVLWRVSLTGDAEAYIDN